MHRQWNQYTYRYLVSLSNGILHFTTSKQTINADLVDNIDIQLRCLQNAKTSPFLNEYLHSYVPIFP